MLILVCGASQSGKTVFSSQLALALTARELHCTVLSTDMFYLDIPPDESLRDHNFDVPGSIDSENLVRCCEQILDENAIDIQVFEFKTHRRSGLLHAEKTDVLIVEGIFAFCIPKLREMASLKIYIDTPETVCAARRYERYSRVLGQRDEFISHKYLTQAKPFFDNVIYPSQRLADYVFSGEKIFDRAVCTVSDHVINLNIRARPAHE